jgi:protein-S-isoprenylcysteine O-methyltransferase Ste14
MTITARLARLRVPLGFGFAVIVFFAARPTRATMLVGALVACAGEAIRWWAAGHLEKGREVTSSGPYRWTRHPLYVGSAVIGMGLAIACRSWIAAAIAIVYLSATLGSAVRAEEAWLHAAFGGDYEAYCQGRTTERPFSVARAMRNREHRAVAGLAIGLLLLALKMS